MAKRKRNAGDDAPEQLMNGAKEATKARQNGGAKQHRKEDRGETLTRTKTKKEKQTETATTITEARSTMATTTSSVAVQIIIGTYEKVLHGLTATVEVGEEQGTTPVSFVDNFLLAAHTSAIRSLAISPTADASDRILLASGGSDQVINLYSISSSPPDRVLAKDKTSLPILNGMRVVENPRNKELGSLQHHAGSVNVLHFPTRSKLMSGAEDNTIAIARTRDWTVLSTIKAPIPKAQGRPSGDTAALGEVPAGINDLAIHPSMKLMLSVGKGERCMRLWNLVTGKKAAVLNFDRDILQQVGEGKYSSGEGRRVRWNGLGEQFTVTFERGCIVYGKDSNPQFCIVPQPRTKIHQVRYVDLPGAKDDPVELLSLSTEDGRILFYPASALDESEQDAGKRSSSATASCLPCAILGRPEDRSKSRVKDFEVLKITGSTKMLFITGSSDGAIQIWSVDALDLVSSLQTHQSSLINGHAPSQKISSSTQPEPQHIGTLLGTYEAGNRITCLAAFIMTSPAIRNEQ